MSLCRRGRKMVLNFDRFLRGLAASKSEQLEEKLAHKKGVRGNGSWQVSRWFVIVLQYILSTITPENKSSVGTAGRDGAEELNQWELQIKLMLLWITTVHSGVREWGHTSKKTIMQRWIEKLQRTLRERVYLGITLDELIKNLKAQAVKGFCIRPKRSTEYCDIEHIYDFWHGCNTSRDGNRHGYLFCVPVQPSGRILQTCKGHFYKMIFKMSYS